ncbi:MAG: hypothetical protein KAR08_08565 [Candidatus Heimdallarchaeota archaeon]|nr:hypothetical protein [Candidatus Heimdallarchaeota archaeon]
MTEGYDEAILRSIKSPQSMSKGINLMNSYINQEKEDIISRIAVSCLRHEYNKIQRDFLC